MYTKARHERRVGAYLLSESAEPTLAHPFQTDVRSPGLLHSMEPEMEPNSRQLRLVRCEGARTLVAEIRVKDRSWIQPTFRVPIFRPPSGLVRPGVCPQEESNLHAWFRKPALCPLSYGGLGVSGASFYFPFTGFNLPEDAIPGMVCITGQGARGAGGARWRLPVPGLRRPSRVGGRPSCQRPRAAA